MLLPAARYGWSHCKASGVAVSRSWEVVDCCFVVAAATIVTTTVFVTPPEDAVRITQPVTFLAAANEKVPVVAPLTTVTAAGTETAVVLLDVRVTVIPDPAEVRVIVQLPELPDATVIGVQVSDDNEAGSKSES